MIEVKDISKRFGAIQAVDNVSFTAEQGEILGFLGPNGAGKSTTMRMITGFLAPSSGTASVCGHDILTAPVAAKRQIGYLPENAPAYAEMTATSFLQFAGELRGFGGAELNGKVEAAIERCRLEKVRNQSVGTLSKGYKQRVCFAQAVLHDPPVLIMDEPTDGLDPNQKHIVRTMIKDMAEKKTIIISTHILEEVDAVCSRAIIISDGRLVANGTPEELRSASRTHGAVEVVFKEPVAGAAGALRALSSADDVDEAGAKCTVYKGGQDGGDLFADVAKLLREKSWPMISLRTLDGRLDEVFQNLTIGDDLSRVG
jgi:ABC-2 type transport system ATP-binding protein